jgi:hypothetical protein
MVKIQNMFFIKMLLLLMTISLIGCSKEGSSLTKETLYIGDSQQEVPSISIDQISELTEKERNYLTEALPALRAYKTEAEKVLKTNTLTTENVTNAKLKEMYASHAKEVEKPREVFLRLNAPKRFKAFHYGTFYVLEEHYHYLIACSTIFDKANDDHINGIFHSEKVFQELHNKNVSSLYSSLGY